MPSGLQIHGQLMYDVIITQKSICRSVLGENNCEHCSLASKVNSNFGSGSRINPLTWGGCVYGYYFSTQNNILYHCLNNHVIYAWSISIAHRSIRFHN